MNGDSKELLDAIVAHGNERHEDNGKKFTKLFDKCDDINKTMAEFPCEAISEKIKGHGTRITWLYVVLGGIIISLVAVAAKSFAQ